MQIWFKIPFVKKRFQLPILILSFVTLSSCATIQPYIQNVNLISVEEEKQLGVQVHEEITKEMKIVTNSSPPTNAHWRFMMPTPTPTPMFRLITVYTT